MRLRGTGVFGIIDTWWKLGLEGGCKVGKTLQKNPGFSALGGNGGKGGRIYGAGNRLRWTMRRYGAARLKPQRNDIGVRPLRCRCEGGGGGFKRA